jgi:plastocyanin/mono/diheme cytochrome c family protein
MNRLSRLLAVGLLLAVVAGITLALTLSSIAGAQPTSSTVAPTGPNPSVTIPPSTTTSAGATTTTTPASSTNVTQPTPDTLPQANPGHGQALYNQQCLICHDVDAEGDGPVHSLFIPEPANLTAVRDAPAMASSIIMNGLPGTAMPAHRNFQQGDINDIVAYVETQPLDTTREWSDAWATPRLPDTAKAQSVFYQACADCHGNDGKGDGAWADKNPYVWPKPANLTAQSSDIGRVFDIITNGIPGTFMAPQAPKFSEEARYALALYVIGFLNPKSQDTVETGSIGMRTNPYTADNEGVWLDGEKDARLYCEYCHGGEVNGTALAPKLTDRQWRYDGGTDKGLFEVILQGVPGKLMPPHPTLSEDTRWRLITFIRHRGGLPDPLKATGTSGNPSSLGGAVTTTSGGSSASSTGSATGSSTGMLTPGALTYATRKISAVDFLVTSAPTVSVEMYNDAFQPANLVVAPGTRVVWVNKDPTAHTTTMNDWDPDKKGAEQVPGAWDSGPLNPGKTFSAVFTQPGTSMYQCAIHPYMIGSVSVDVSMIGAYSPIGRAGAGLGWWWAAIGVGIVIVLVIAFFALVWGRWVGRRNPTGETR